MLHKRKHSVDTEGSLAVAEHTVQIEPLASDTNTQTISSETELNTKEHQAATVIQSAFRAFLVLYSLFDYHVITDDLKKIKQNIAFCNVDKSTVPTQDSALCLQHGKCHKMLSANLKITMDENKGKMGFM